MVELTVPDFTPMIKTMVYPSRANRAGCPDYLDVSTKDSFRKRLMKELLPKNGNLTRSDYWYLSYYHQPYMHKISRHEFLRRWADIQDNLNVISENNKIGMGDIRKDETWIKRFTELLAESQFRGGIPTNEIAYETILHNISLNHFIQPEKSIRQLPYIFKFGKLEHLKQMKENGLIRLVNSKTYLSNSMNHGQQDDENNFTFTIFPELLNGLDGQTGLAEIDPIKKSEFVKITHQVPQDYLMWCAAHKYDFRMPHAFNAEALAIITEPRRFKKDVAKALKAKKLIPTIGKVRYFDPYLDLETKLDVRFAKHFRFSYQHEFRVVAQGSQLDDHMFLSIEHLPEYCEIIELTSAATPKSTN